MNAMILVLGFVSVGIVGCLSAMAGQLYERRKWERRLLEQAGIRFDDPPAPRIAQAAPNDRLERLEHAVDAIAVEMERVGEGQRFVTKLLAERRPERTPPSPIPGAVRPPSRPTAS